MFQLVCFILTVHKEVSEMVVQQVNNVCIV